MSGNEENKPKRDRKPNGRFDIGNRVQMLGTHGSKYRPEYCAMLVDHMTKGYSYESFAGMLGVSRQTIYDWEKNHPEYADAKSIATARSLFWWESVMLEHIVHTQRGARVDPNMWKYNMTVRFPDKWREETIQHQHQTITEVTITEKKRED